MSAPAFFEAPARPEAAEAVADAYRDAFGETPEGVWSAPGRVNLIGEHVDYTGGLCLPLALPHRTFVAPSPRHDDLVRVRSAPEAGADREGSLAEVAPGSPECCADYGAWGP